MLPLLFTDLAQRHKIFPLNYGAVVWSSHFCETLFSPVAATLITSRNESTRAMDHKWTVDVTMHAQLWMFAFSRALFLLPVNIFVFFFITPLRNVRKRLQRSDENRPNHKNCWNYYSIGDEAKKKTNRNKNHIFAKICAWQALGQITSTKERGMTKIELSFRLRSRVNKKRTIMKVCRKKLSKNHRKIFSAGCDELMNTRKGDTNNKKWDNSFSTQKTYLNLDQLIVYSTYWPRIWFVLFAVTVWRTSRTWTMFLVKKKRIEKFIA